MAQPLPKQSSVKCQSDLIPQEWDIIRQRCMELKRNELLKVRKDLYFEMNPEHQHVFHFGDALFAAAPRTNIGLHPKYAWVPPSITPAGLRLATKNPSIWMPKFSIYVICVCDDYICFLTEYHYDQTHL